MLFNFLKNVQTARMDTTAMVPVALIAMCLGCVKGKQDIVTVKWDGNQIHVTQVRLKQRDNVVNFLGHLSYSGYSGTLL